MLAITGHQQRRGGGVDRRAITPPPAKFCLSESIILVSNITDSMQTASFQL